MTSARWQSLCVVAAGLNGAVAMGLAAYAAHGVDGQAVGWIERGSRYQLIHAVVLLVLGVGRGQGSWLKAASLLFFTGSILFSGALYAMALASLPVMYLVPFGGSCFILGWLALAAAGLTLKDHPQINAEKKQGD